MSKANKITLALLDRDVNETQVEALFAKFGSVTEVKIARDAAGRSRGFATVLMKDAPAAAKAVNALNGQTLGSQAFVARLLNPEPEASDAPESASALLWNKDIARDLFTFKDVWDLRPGEGVGPLDFGMNRRQVAKCLGAKSVDYLRWSTYAPPTAVLKKRARRVTEIESGRVDFAYRTQEKDLGVHIYFDPDDGGAQCFVFEFPVQQIRLASVALMGQPLDEVFTFIRAQDPRAKRLEFKNPGDKPTLYSLALGIAAQEGPMNGAGQPIFRYLARLEVFNQIFGKIKYSKA